MPSQKPGIFAQIAAGGVCLGGVMVLLGWTFDITTLKSIVSGWPRMTPVTAVAFLLSGVALWCRAAVVPEEAGNAGPTTRRNLLKVSQAGALLLILVGALKLADDLFSLNLAFDTLVFRDVVTPAGSLARTAHATAFNFVLLGCALMVAGHARRVMLFQTLVLMAGLIGCLGLSRYVFGSETLRPFQLMAANTAAGFLLLSAGVYCLRPQGGLTELLMADRPGVTLSGPAAFGVAVVLTAIALLVRVTIGSGLAGPTMIVFTVPIILSAYFGGLGPGLLATLLSGLGAAYFVLPPIFSFNVSSPTHLWQLAVLFVTGGLISGICEKLRQSRRRAEAIIAELEHKEIELRQALKDAGDLRVALDEHAIVAATDPQGKITYANDKFCAIAKYSRKELLGQDHRILNSGHHAKEFIRDLWTTIANGKVWHGEIKNQAKDGSFFWVDTTIVPFLNEEGQPRQYVDIRADITERKRTEAALRESEELFSKAFRMSPDCVVIGRLSDRTVIRANEALCHLWGSTPEEVIGRPTREYANWVNEEKRLAFMRTLNDGGECLDYETVLRLTDGRLVDFNISSRLITFNGESCVLSVMRDVTERKRTEAAAARLAAIVTFSDDAIIGKNLDGIVTSWNAGAERIFGYAAEEMLGQPITRLIPPDRHHEEPEILARVRRGESVQHFDTVRLRKDGSLVDVSIATSAIKDAAGKVIGASKVARDITERKQAQQILSASEARLRMVTDNARVGLVMVNRERRYTFANATYAEILGLPSPDLVGQRVADMLAPLYEDQVRPRLDRAFAGERVAYELQRPAPGGDRYYSVRYEPTRVGDSVSLVVVVITDITKRKQAEAAARESQKMLRLTLDAAQIGHWDLDLVTHVANRSVQHDQLFGYEELLSDWTYEKFLTHVHPEDRERVNQLFQAGVVAKTQWDFECRIHRRDGALRWIWAYGNVFSNAAGEAVRMLGMVSDITERKEAEEALREAHGTLEKRVIERTAQLEAANTELRDSRAELQSLFESLPGLYLVLTPDLKIVAASDAYLEATLTTRADILGRQLFEVFPDNPDDPGTKAVANMRASMDRVLHHSAPDIMAISKHDVRRPDGVFEEHYWSPSNSPLFGPDHRIKYIVHRVEEVTEFVRRKSQTPGSTTELSARLQQMEAEIFQNSQKMQATNTQLESANQELAAFSYSVSHDLRAPLRGMDGFSQALLEDYAGQLDATGQDYLRRIRAAAQRMGQLIDDLLNLSRVTRSEMKLDTVNLTTLAHKVVTGLQPQQAGRSIQWEVRDPLSARGDSRLLEIALENLLGNALKFTGQCEQARIEFGQQAQGAESVFFVRDNGAGFDMAYANRLFGAFQRLHSPQDFPGTGIGLATVQRMIHRHGGRVWAEARPGKGATFYFTLPTPH